jgi:hypothetical protein
MTPLVVRAWTHDGEDFSEARRKRIENYLRTEGFENARLMRVSNSEYSIFANWGKNLAELINDIAEGLKR